MNEEHENYRPKSPDLSALPPPPPPRLSRIPSYPDSFPPGSSFSPRGSYDASPFFSPQTNTPSTSYFGPRAQSSTTTITPQHQSPPPFRAPIPHTQSPQQTVLPQTQSLYHPQPPTHYQAPYQPDYTPSYINQEPVGFQYSHQPTIYHSQSNLNYPSEQNPDYYSLDPGNHHPHQISAPSQTYGEMPRTRQKRAAEEADPAFNPHGPPRHEMPMPLKTEQFQPTMPGPPSDPSLGIDIKTKFPVARIKRIMQADEDVGKVAQATPTAVSKALELFMIALVSKGAEEAKANNSKRVTAQHLKAGLMKDPQYDFLTDMCETVPEEGTKKGRAKSEPGTDTEDEVAPKKKAKGARKRKADTSDDSD